jgi:predicted permease
METSGVIFTAIIPIFLIIGAGFLARRVRWLTAEADRSLMALVVNLLYPALILKFVLGNEALQQPSNLILPPLVGFATIVGGFALAMTAARSIGLTDPREARTFAFATGMYNYGYFPIPIVALLFGSETLGVLLVHNVGVEIAMWSIGVGFILSADDPKPFWRRALSPPVISILVAVPLNLAGAGPRLPDVLLETIDLLAVCAVPLGLLLSGATFADLARGFKIRERPRIPLTAVALQLGAFPAIFLLCAILLPFPRELKQVMIVQAAMPGAVIPIVLARHFDGSPAIALKVVLATTAASLVTVPLWIGLGLRLIGE